MAGYKYPFEPVLKHRKFIEEMLQKDLAELKRIYDKAIMRWKKLKTAEKKSLEELRQMKAECINIPKVKLYMNYLDRLLIDIGKQKKQVKIEERKWNLKREELATAMKNRKALEKLKEKGLERFKKEMNKKERKYFDEVSIRTFTREM